MQAWSEPQSETWYAMAKNWKVPSEMFSATNHVVLQTKGLQQCWHCSLGLTGKNCRCGQSNQNMLQRISMNPMLVELAAQRVKLWWRHFVSANMSWDCQSWMRSSTTPCWQAVSGAWMLQETLSNRVDRFCFQKLNSLRSSWYPTWIFLTGTLQDAFYLPFTAGRDGQIWRSSVIWPLIQQRRNWDLWVLWKVQQGFRKQVRQLWNGLCRCHWLHPYEGWQKGCGLSSGLTFSSRFSSTWLQNP